jgi:alkanesulfonate monooxygenase SsuD/methylene tetrahydromethanopterin reductase-like flavin-dependent oxidoreductase (luciferase family)
MSRSFRFAVQCMCRDVRDEIAGAAVAAESFGYEEFYSSDHFGKSDPFVPLMIAAEVTTDLRVGPLVLNNEFHNPGLLARTAADVDRLTGGRLVLGLGTGYDEYEHAAIGMELRAPGPRVTRYEESIIVIRSLLESGAASFDGRHVKVEIDDLGIRPIGNVPFLRGSTAQIVDKRERLRDDIGVSHVVVRDGEQFAPVVEALAGR